MNQVNRASIGSNMRSGSIALENLVVYVHGLCGQCAGFSQHIVLGCEALDGLDVLPDDVLPLRYGSLRLHDHLQLGLQSLQHL